MTEIEREEIGLAEAAQRLGISWQRAWRLVLTGELHGNQRGGRWFVRTDSIAQREALTANDRSTGE